jgi:hypothetical protein
LYQQGSQRYGIRFILNGACDICVCFDMIHMILSFWTRNSRVYNSELDS